MTSKTGLNRDFEQLNLSILPNNSFRTFFKGINNINRNDIDVAETSPEIKCSYIDIDSFCYEKSKESFSLFHLNIASLAKNKEELETILNMIDLKFDVIGITETKIKCKNPVIDTNINGYKYYSTPTEADKGGAILHIKEECNVKPLPKLDKIIYKPKHLESVFIEICNKNKKNTIIGCIYRHPLMDLHEFNEDYFDVLMEKLASEDKKVFLMGDFNIDLLKVDIDTPTANFFDTITSNLLALHILLPTRITTTTKTLIDNIYSNCTNYIDGISGNITIAILIILHNF